MRKTVDVERIRKAVNTLLASEINPLYPVEVTSPAEAYRRGAASVLEMILHDSGNYRGFSYLAETFENTDGVTTDQSRRSYYA